MSSEATPKVLAKSNPEKASAIAYFLLATGILDPATPMEDRRRFIEEGEVIDTPRGRLIFGLVRDTIARARGQEVKP
jgi:hypothetical protein